MSSDPELRDAFRELRGDDARRAPAFQDLLGRRRPSRTVPRWRLAAAAAAAAAVLIAAALTLAPRRPQTVDTASWAELSTWQASTDELLTLPDTPWNGTGATLTDDFLTRSARNDG